MSATMGGQPPLGMGMMGGPSPGNAGAPPGLPAPGTGGAPPGPTGVPPGAMPNPAFVAWQQANQARQAIIASNTQKQQQFDAACALIRKDGLRGFKLDIEADSTIAPDEQAERESRTGFLKEIVPLISEVVPIAQGNPKMAKFASEVVMFAIRGFRVARTLEEAAEAAFEVVGQMPPPAPKGGHGVQQDPAIEQAKIAANVHDTAVKAQTDLSEMQGKQQIAQATLMQKEQQANDQMQMARERMAAEQQHNAAQLAIENERLRSSERVQQARVTASNARGASGLV